MTPPNAATPLDPDDARILALETGPIRGHTMMVLVLDDAPDDDVVEALRTAVGERLAAVPRWRQRLVASAESATGFAWVDDPHFDIAQHIRAIDATEPIDERRLREIAAESMKVPLARSRPLWTMDVVPRLADGRWAIVWKTHHCLADGMAKLRAGATLLWTEAGSPKRDSHPSHPSRPHERPLRERVANVIHLRGLVLREFRRVRRLSPLAAPVGSARALAFTSCTLDELHAIGRAIGPDVTINDVLLAVVAGALRRWLQIHDASGGRLKVQVPVSMRPRAGGGEAQGNRNSFLFISLPVRESDPVARVRAVNKATRDRKNRHDANAIEALRTFLSRLPAPIRRALQQFAQGPQEYSLNVSNIPGPAGPIAVLGHRVDALYSIAEIAPHHALRVAAVSMNGTLYISLCADPQVVPDLDSIARDVRRSVDELEAAA